MVDHDLEEAKKSNHAGDQQKAGLQSKAQSVFCYLNDALFRQSDVQTQLGSHRAYTLIL